MSGYDSQQTINDEELTAIALASDPGAPVAPDAVPLATFLAPDGEQLLPEWYMPSPMGVARPLRGWRRRVIFLVIASFILINAYGLCSTYGHVGFG